VYKTTYLSTLSYTSETWSLTTKYISQIQSMEMRYRRREGKTRRDKDRNQTIRLGLGAMPLQSTIEESQLRWFGHVCCMNNERYPKMVWQARQQGKRPRGRPRQTWEDGIKDVLKRKGMDMTEAKNWAEDRARSRALCKPSTPIGRRGSD
jgi:hypothetical protein